MPTGQQTKIGTKQYEKFRLTIVYHIWRGIAMKITIKSIIIENFKGIELFELNPDCKSMSVYGDNAKGKSTIYDALTWLLFGKDSHGASTFNIKPLDSNGNVIMGLMPTVTAVINADDTQIILKKSYREKWEKVRGSASKRFSGNTVDYFVDDVPCKEKDYKAFISELVDENEFRQLTSVTYFCSDIKWQDRREKLFEFCNVPSDEALLATVPEFKELNTLCAGKPISDFKAKLMAQRKSANTELDSLPIRIDEQKKTIAPLEQADYTGYKAEIARIEKEEQALNARLSACDGSLVVAKQAEIAETNNSIREIELENKEHISQNVPIEDLSDKLKSDWARCMDEVIRAEKDIKNTRELIEDIDKRISSYRKEWQAIDTEKFVFDGTCATCGQALQQEQINEAHKYFMDNQNRRKNDIVSCANRFKNEKAELEQNLITFTEKYEKSKQKADEAHIAYTNYAKPVSAIIEDLPGYSQAIEKLNTIKINLENELKQIESQSEQYKFMVRSDLAKLSLEKSEYFGYLADEKKIAEGYNRIKELQEEQKAKAVFLEDIDRKLDLCEQFILYKINSITETVNNAFDLVKFKLFNTQVNGGIVECCEVTASGVPYADLNNAAKINAGLDIINSFTRKSDIHVPLFVDNAESVTLLKEVDTQVIRLVVSENHKKLHMEVVK